MSALLLSCSSSYSPSEKMLQLKKGMDVDTAVSIMQQAIWNDDINLGICGSRGFWFDKESAMKVKPSGIELLAHKRGKQLDVRHLNVDELVVFEKQYYKYLFDFTAVQLINIYDDPLLLPLFPDCNKRHFKSQYYIIDLYTEDLVNLKFIVARDRFDYVMAATSLLFVGTPIKLK